MKNYLFVSLLWVVLDTDFEARSGFRIIRFKKNEIQISGGCRIPDIRPYIRICFNIMEHLNFFLILILITLANDVIRKKGIMLS